jgi:hypothetical protein
MRHVLLALVLMCAASLANAQVFFANTRVGSVAHTHATVDTTTAAAIATGSVAANLLGWQLCNDAVNASSTYLLVGKATDVATDGVMLAKGQCFVCPNCTGATLKLIKVKGQGATNGYSIIQYKQQ